MTDLAARLAEALDRAELAAHAAGGDQWTMDDGPFNASIRDSSGSKVVSDEGLATDDQHRHIVAWSPATVLRLIERERGLLAAYASVSEGLAEHVGQCGLDPCSHYGYRISATTLQVLTTAVEVAARFWLTDPKETR